MSLGCRASGFYASVLPSFFENAPHRCVGWRRLPVASYFTTLPSADSKL